MNKIVKFAVGALIFGTGFITGAFVMKSKMDKEMDELIEAEVSDYREHYKKKEAELAETEEKIKKARYQELVENYKEKAQDENQEQYEYPSSVAEIEEYNTDNGFYKELEFISEEEYQYDEESVDSKIECRMYMDGTIYTTTGTQVTEDDIGNMCSGMGIQDSLRYIRNWEQKVDYCVEYFDEEPATKEEETE